MKKLIVAQIEPEEIMAMFREELANYFSSRSQMTTKVDEDEQLLTISQAADLLHLAVSTIYGHVHKHAIPHCRKGKRLYFIKQELLNWVKDGRKKTMTEIMAEAKALAQKR